LTAAEALALANKGGTGMGVDDTGTDGAGDEAGGRTGRPADLGLRSFEGEAVAFIVATCTTGSFSSRKGTW
jgi:hypothetical protein